MKSKIVILVMFLVVVNSLSAFDNKRKGFLLGFGAGLANVTYNQEVSYNGYSETSGDWKEKAFGTDFKIGYAPNNRTEIYYTSKVAWFSIVNIYGDDVSITDGLGAAAVSYFFDSKLDKVDWCPSAFVSAGVGFSAWNSPDEKDAEAWTGHGFFLGAGYEFKKHFRVSVDFYLGNPSTEENGWEYTTNSSVLMFTFSGMAF